MSAAEARTSSGLKDNDDDDGDGCDDDDDKILTDHFSSSAPSSTPSYPTSFNQNKERKKNDFRKNLVLQRDKNLSSNDLPRLQYIFLDQHRMKIEVSYAGLEKTSPLFSASGVAGSDVVRERES